MKKIYIQHRVSLVAQCKESVWNAGDVSLFLSWEDPLKKEMATYSSILTWRIPWIDGISRVKHNLGMKSPPPYTIR